MRRARHGDRYTAWTGRGLSGGLLLCGERLGPVRGAIDRLSTALGPVVRVRAVMEVGPSGPSREVMQWEEMDVARCGAEGGAVERDLVDIGGEYRGVGT